MISTGFDCHYLKKGPSVSGQPFIQQRINLSQASEEWETQKPMCQCSHLEKEGGEAGKQPELDTVAGTKTNREYWGRGLEMSVGKRSLGLV